VLTLEADQPGLFTTVAVDQPGYFSDNAITLLPGRPTVLGFTPRHGGKFSAQELAATLSIRTLADTF
jgi:beta-mannosidase